MVAFRVCGEPLKRLLEHEFMVWLSTCGEESQTKNVPEILLFFKL
jgi:hypothetical protein